MFSADTIRDIEFQKAGFNGYKSSDVDAFIDEVAEEYEQLSKKNDDLLQKIQILADTIEQYKNNEDLVKTAIINAQRTGDTILKEAENKVREVTEEKLGKAEQLLISAKEESERITNEANAKARVTVDNATMKANNIIDDAERKAKNAKAEIDRLINQQMLSYNYVKDQVSKFKDKLVTEYKQHLELIVNTAESDRFLEDYNKKIATESEDNSTPAE